MSFEEYKEAVYEESKEFGGDLPTSSELDAKLKLEYDRYPVVTAIKGGMYLVLNEIWKRDKK